MAEKIPTKWVTMDAEWGEGKKHIWCPDEESLKFHETEYDAKKHATDEIQGGCKMVAICEIKTLYVARAVAFDKVETS